MDGWGNWGCHVTLLPSVAQLMRAGMHTWVCLAPRTMISIPARCLYIHRSHSFPTNPGLWMTWHLLLTSFSLWASVVGPWGKAGPATMRLCVGTNLEDLAQPCNDSVNGRCFHLAGRSWQCIPVSEYLLCHLVGTEHAGWKWGCNLIAGWSVHVLDGTNSA